jgi:hypothetical protein
MPSSKPAVEEYLADKRFYSGPTWEVQPVRTAGGDVVVHLWPMADESPEVCLLLPDDAIRLGNALISCAVYASEYPGD